MARKSGNTSILQIDAQMISRLAVQHSPKGLEVVASAVERGPWSLEDGSLARALKAFVEKHAMAADTVCTVLPRHEVTTRILRLPTHIPAEIENMVRYSAEEWVPYAADELIIDQCILQKWPEGEASVLAVVAHKDVVEGHIAVLREAGLEPDRVFLSTACLVSAAVASHGDDDGRYALVYLASGGLEIVIIDQKRLQYGRGIATVQDWSFHTGAEGEAALQELAVEVRGSLTAYRRESEDGMGVDKVYLCSEWADVAPLCEPLAQETGKECLPADFARRLVTKGLDQVTSLPVASLGAALAAQGRAALSISLIPESMAEVRRFQGARTRVLRGLAMVAAVLLALAGLFAQAVYQRQQMAKELGERLDALAPNARGIQEKQAQLRILRQQVSRTGTVLELLASVWEAAPESDLNVNRFTYHRDEGINTWGRAKTVEDVAAFAEGLRKLAQGNLSLFAHARSLYEEKVVEQKDSVFSYQIAIVPPEEEDADQATPSAE